MVVIKSKFSFQLDAVTQLNDYPIPFLRNLSERQLVLKNLTGLRVKTFNSGMKRLHSVLSTESTYFIQSWLINN